MVDADKRWQVLGERCAQPLRDPTSGPVFRDSAEVYLTGHRSSIRYIDSHNSKTRDLSVCAQ
jgi:hypothetical protein